MSIGMKRCGNGRMPDEKCTKLILQQNNVNFEIKIQFMRELREDAFLGNKNDDAHEHIEKILDIVSLFNIPRVSHDITMFRVFPITLTGAAKRWIDMIPSGTINT
uniref:Reverse transcriptase domain-containing protein n=1 Tax=Tanacetum cinerariifolium TaxID=118510 RepID=A0A6L2M830_TANCI|nr:hypothetical protein [Tanacetum cinerariifolium]